MSVEMVTQSFELYDDQLQSLKKMAEDFDLPDGGKALRCLINFAREDGDLAEIFQSIRCRNC